MLRARRLRSPQELLAFSLVTLPSIVTNRFAWSLPASLRPVGGEAVTQRLRNRYRPRGRAAPKKRPASDFAKPMWSYINSRVRSDAPRAFLAPNHRSRP